MNILVALDFFSMLMFVASFIVLAYVLLKHFKGMQVPPYWIYFIGGFALLSIESFISQSAPDNERVMVLGVVIKLMANFSILFASLEIFKIYESKLHQRISSIASNPSTKQVGKRKIRKKKNQR